MKLAGCGFAWLVAGYSLANGDGGSIRGQGQPIMERELSAEISCATPRCTNAVLDTYACTHSECHTCRARISWLMSAGSLSEVDACTQVARVEFPEDCGDCAPGDPPSGLRLVDDKNVCGCKTCTLEALDNMACVNGGACHSCGTWMLWQQAVQGRTEMDACTTVGDVEFPDECEACNPLTCKTPAISTDAPTTAVLTNSPGNAPTDIPTSVPSIVFNMTDVSTTNTPTGIPTNVPTMVTPTIHAPTVSNTTVAPTKDQITPLPTASPTGPVACTDQGDDPYVTGQAQDCCDGLTSCLDDHFRDGHWHYRCVSDCPTTAPPVNAPTPNTTFDCGCHECSQQVLETMACDDPVGCFTCASRMTWLQSQGGTMSVERACLRVATEFPSLCGPCACGRGGGGPSRDNPLNGTTTYEPANPEDLVWWDEFNAPGVNHPPDPTKWNYRIGGSGFGNHELQYYTDHLENAVVSNGTLQLMAKREDLGGRQFTSARLHTTHKGDWLYGRIAVRARLEQCTARGTWPAIWMLPTEWKYGGWPTSGEIDIMEHVGYDTGRVHGTVHTEAYNHMMGTQVGSSTTTNVSDWHEYQVVWTPERIDFVLDGTIYHAFGKQDGDSYREWPFDQSFHLVLNVAVGGNWGAVQGVDESAFLKGSGGQRMEVDWVRVYSK